MLVYAVVDDSLSPASPLRDAIDVFVRREDAERFIEKIRRRRARAGGAATDRGTRA